MATRSAATHTESFRKGRASAVRKEKAHVTGPASQTLRNDTAADETRCRSRGQKQDSTGLGGVLSCFCEKKEHAKGQTPTRNEAQPKRQPRRRLKAETKPRPARCSSSPAQKGNPIGRAKEEDAPSRPPPSARQNSAASANITPNMRRPETPRGASGPTAEKENPRARKRMTSGRADSGRSTRSSCKPTPPSGKAPACAASRG